MMVMVMVVMMLVISLILLRVRGVVFCVQVVRRLRQARPGIPDQTAFAAGHLSGAVGAQVAQLLLLLLFHAPTFIGFPAKVHFTGCQFVLLTVFGIVDLSIQGALQLFA